MKLELGAEVDESLVAECFERAVCDQCGHLLQVPDEGLEVGAVQGQLAAVLALGDAEHAALHAEAVAEVGGEGRLPVVARGLGRVHLQTGRHGGEEEEPELVTWWSSRRTPDEAEDDLSAPCAAPEAELAWRKWSQSAENLWREIFM